MVETGVEELAIPAFVTVELTTSPVAVAPETAGMVAAMADAQYEVPKAMTDE